MWSVGTLTNGGQSTLKLYFTPTHTVVWKNVTDTATETQNEYDSTINSGKVTVHVIYTITISQLETAALTVKNYYESHQALPASVTINSQIITMPEFLQLLVTGAININNNNLNSITSQYR